MIIIRVIKIGNGRESEVKKPRHDTGARRLVLIEDLLDLLRIFGLRQSQLQQNARFLRVQRARGDEAVFRIIHFGILSGSARRYAGRTHDCSTVFRGGRQRVEHRFIQVAVTHTSANDAIIARIYQCFSRKIGCVSVVINNADFRQFIQLRDIEWRVAGMLTCRGTLVVNELSGTCPKVAPTNF